MTRQEHINHAKILIDNILINRYQYEGLYHDLIGKRIEYSPLEEAGFTIYPTWEELIIKLKPWLATDETLKEWFKK